MSNNPCIKVYKLMSGFDRTWFFAGGWAIDLFIGKQTRPHQDIEIALFRNDQQSLKEYLNDWDFKKVIKGEFLSWEDEFLELPTHEVHASNKQNGNKLEILLNETDNENWRFRRNMNIKRGRDCTWSYTDTGLPYLNPEIVLLYKAKNTKIKDHQDFLMVKDYLDSEQKKWLRNAINLHEPEHKWLQYI